jgi:hypothetical protein
MLLCAGRGLAEGMTPSVRNEKLLSCNEAFETLTEISLSADAKQITAAWKEAKAQHDVLALLLDDAGKKKLDELLAAGSQSYKQKKYTELSLAAVEIYQFVVLACDATALDVPAPVHLLDYRGFRSKALLQGQPINWPTLIENSAETRHEWLKVSDQVTDQKLLKSMNEAIDGMIKGAAAHDENLLKSATEEELALVDKLEVSLKRKK